MMKLLPKKFLKDTFDRFKRNGDFDQLSVIYNLNKFNRNKVRKIIVNNIKNLPSIEIRYNINIKSESISLLKINENLGNITTINKFKQAFYILESWHKLEKKRLIIYNKYKDLLEPYYEFFKLKSTQNFNQLLNNIKNRMKQLGDTDQDEIIKSYYPILLKPEQYRELLLLFPRQNFTNELKVTYLKFKRKFNEIKQLEKEKEKLENKSKTRVTKIVKLHFNKLFSRIDNIKEELLFKYEIKDKFFHNNVMKLFTDNKDKIKSVENLIKYVKNDVIKYDFLKKAIKLYIEYLNIHIKLDYPDKIIYDIGQKVNIEFTHDYKTYTTHGICNSSYEFLKNREYLIKVYHREAYDNFLIKLNERLITIEDLEELLNEF